MLGLIGNTYIFHHRLEDTDPEDLTGNKVTFVYPDLQTSLKGTFDHGIMTGAMEVEVVATKCDKFGAPVIVETTEPKNDGIVYYYDPPTNETFAGGPPNVPDPFDSRWGELQPASSIPDSGEGLMLRKDPLGSMPLALYTGFHYNKPEQAEIFAAKYCHNKSLSDDQKRHCMKYSLDIMYENSTIGIPWEYDQPGSIHPSLGPKINHHFTKSNVEFAEIETPRWGLTMSLLLPKDKVGQVQAGDELFAFYEYRKEKFPFDVPWYWEQKKKLQDLGELPCDGDEMISSKNKKKKKKKKQKSKSTSKASKTKE